MNNKGISRRDFIKGAGGMMGIATLGLLAGCGEQEVVDEGGAIFKAGTYTSLQNSNYATVEVKCTFSETALTDVSYEVVSTTKADYFAPLKSQLDSYCQSVVEAGKTDDVDLVSGASFSSTAIKDGIDACMIQALGINLKNNDVNQLNPQNEDYRKFESNLDKVFSPIQLGSMTINNRVIKSAGSGPWADANGDKVSVATELYGTMAKNDLALVILPGVPGNTGLSPDSLEVEGDVETAIHGADSLINAIHDGGAKVGYQIFFGGGNPVVPNSLINDTPVEELEAFLERVGEAARRAKRVGIDCMEIKGASADALNGFLTRRVNRREDEYGPQSIENRTRLFRQMIQKIKEVNGSDFPVGVLINGVEENDKNLGDNELYLTIEESKEIAKALVNAGADWIQVRVGAVGQEMNIWAPDVQHIANETHGITGYGTQFDYSEHFEGLVDGSRSGFASFLPIVKEIKKVVDVPVGCAADLDLRLGPDFINNAIANGELDLVFMNRPLNCDPELVRKMKEGNRKDVRPCMKCMHCHDNIGSNRRYKSSCRMNAASYNSLTKTMPEGAIPLKADVKKNIMVIGAGPAGMEAARVAAERGHNVTIYDADSKLGGLVNFAKGVKGNHENFDDYLEYIEYQLDKNNVTINLNTRVDAKLVKEQNPDAVVIAVGGQRESKLTSSSNVAVLSPTQAFSVNNLGEKVCILGANVQAVDFASWLVNRGKKVVMVHPDAASEVDKGQAGWFKQYIEAFLKSKGTKFWHNAEVLGVENNGVKIKSDAGLETFIECDSVVEFYNMIPNTSLADELSSAGFEVYTIGDCKDPHNIQRAVLTGNLVARSL